MINTVKQGCWIFPAAAALMCGRALSWWRGSWGSRGAFQNLHCIFNIAEVCEHDFACWLRSLELSRHRSSIVMEHYRHFLAFGVKILHLAFIIWDTSIHESTTLTVTVQKQLSVNAQSLPFQVIKEHVGACNHSSAIIDCTCRWYPTCGRHLDWRYVTIHSNEFINLIPVPVAVHGLPIHSL